MDAFEEAKQQLFLVIAEVEESSLSCNICTEAFNDSTNRPMLFRCKHTYCSKCISLHYHYKNFGGVDGLCVVDRTERLEGVNGEPNHFMMECMKQLSDMKRFIKHLEQRDITKDIKRLHEQNGKLEQSLIRTSELLSISEKSVRKLKAMIDLQIHAEGSRSEVQEKLNYQRTSNFYLKERLMDIREQIRTAKRETEKARSHTEKAMLQAENEIKMGDTKLQKDKNNERRKRKNRKKGKASDSDEEIHMKDTSEYVQVMERRSKPQPNPFSVLDADDSDTE